MKRIILPDPPNPANFTGNPIGLARATYDWQVRVKSLLEQASQINNAPLDQAFTLTTGYTVTTNIAGTSTGTQITNFLCSLIAAMQRKGLVSPNLGGQS